MIDYGIEKIVMTPAKSDGSYPNFETATPKAEVKLIVLDSLTKDKEVAFDENASGFDKISAGINGIVSLINIAVSASARRKDAEREFYANSLAFAHEYALALNEQLRLQSEMSESGFVKDYSGRIKDGFAAANEAMGEYNKALSELSKGKAITSLRDAVDWGNVGKATAAGAGAGAALGGIVGSVVPVIGTAIGAAVGAAAGAVGGFFTGLFGGKKKKEVLGGLLDIFPELIDGSGELNKNLAQSLINTKQVDDSTKQLLQNALDWAGAVEEANKQIKDIVVDLAGDFGNSLRNSIVDAWKAGEDAAGRMFDAASRSLENFIENLIWSTVMSPVFDEFSDMIVDALLNGEGNIVDAYEWLMGQMSGEAGKLVTDSLQNIKDYAEKRGFNMWTGDDKDTANKSLSTGIQKSITEETGSVIAGQFNAMRIYLADMSLLQQRQFEEQINLTDLSRQTVTVLRDSLLYHRETAQNTAVLHEINDRLENMSNKQSLPATDPYKAKGQ